MPSYEIYIGDVDVASDTQPYRGEPRSEVRSVYWRGDAPDEGAARQAGWKAWNQEYGPGRQPVNALVKVTAVAA